MVRQLFEDWIAKAVLVMGTWATGAQGWFHWLSVPAEARATLEKQYMLQKPDAQDQLEGLLRVELLE
eukprot:652300-Amphidinium_carterae.1